MSIEQDLRERLRQVDAERLSAIQACERHIHAKHMAEQREFLLENALRKAIMQLHIAREVIRSSAQQIATDINDDARELENMVKLVEERRKGDPNGHKRTDEGGDID